MTHKDASGAGPDPEGMVKKQQQRTFLLLALLASFPPMSTDMYLPALPLLQTQWRVTLATINLTLVLFFVFFSISLLIYGPVSDSYGRRPLLLTGIGIYIAASILCAWAPGVVYLVLSRILQAMGAAAASALSMAIAKDLYAAKARQQLLAHLGVVVALAPMLAPILGGLVLKWLTWHWIFLFQAGWGGLALWGVFRMPEPLAVKVPASFGQVAGRYAGLFRNVRYMSLNVLMGLSLCPIFAFIAGSPTIYISRFHVSEQTFGYFFGINAMAFMAGSFTCGRLTGRMNGWPLLIAGFAGVAGGGLAMWGAGEQGPIPFAVAMFIITFSIGLTRPMSNNLVLEQVERDVGAASSLLVFIYFAVGAASMGLISLTWADHIRVIAVLSTASGVLMLCAFHWMAYFWKEVLEPVKKLSSTRP